MSIYRGSAVFISLFGELFLKLESFGEVASVGKVGKVGEARKLRKADR